MWTSSIQLKSLEDTRNVAKKIALQLKRGDVLALFGTLGAGKTTFTRYILEQFGIEEVPSPTFTLLQTYDLPHTIFYHFDLYRLNTPEEALNLGLEEAFYLGTSLIEWPERLGRLLPSTALMCSFESTPLFERILTFKGSAEWEQRLKNIF
jgi:tRNA threonylcarbamoyl adenosine modification protein YjeE